MEFRVPVDWIGLMLKISFSFPFLFLGPKARSVFSNFVKYSRSVATNHRKNGTREGNNLRVDTLMTMTDWKELGVVWLLGQQFHSVQFQCWVIQASWVPIHNFVFLYCISIVSLFNCVNPLTNKITSFEWCF